MRTMTALIIAGLAGLWLAGCGDSGSQNGSNGGDRRRGEGRWQGERGNREEGTPAEGERARRDDRRPDRGADDTMDTATLEQQRAEWQKEQRANAATVRVPLAAAIPKAVAAVPGQVIGVRLERNNNAPVYAVEVLTDTESVTVTVSAITGSVLSVGPARARGGRWRDPAGGADSGSRSDRRNANG